MSKKGLDGLSLFTGTGGFDAGFEGDITVGGKYYPPTGVKFNFASDINKYSKESFDRYWANRGGLHLHLESIIDLVKNHASGVHVFPRSDLVIGGFPCKDFSLSGKREGFSSKKNHLGKYQTGSTQESRGMLYYWMSLAIGLIKPAMFIAENVKGLESIPGAIPQIVKDFSSNGYIVQHKTMCVADYGVPQSRKRVIFVGVRDDLLLKRGRKLLQNDAHYLFPKPTGILVTCGQVLAGLLEPHLSLDPSQQAYSKAAWLGKKRQGQTEISLDDVGPTIRAEHHGNIEYRRLSKAHGGKHTKELAAGQKERRLTVRECARLQTFPDDYKFVEGGVSASEAYKLIGNAVPPVFAHALAQHIVGVWTILFGSRYKI